MMAAGDMPPARVMELVDIADLKSAGFGRTGSSPVLRTTRHYLLGLLNLACSILIQEGF